MAEATVGLETQVGLNEVPYPGWLLEPKSGDILVDLVVIISIGTALEDERPTETEI